MLFSQLHLQVHERERNYTVCYVSFTLFMLGTMLVATRLPFNYNTPSHDSSANLQNAATVSSPSDVRSSPTSISKVLNHCCVCVSILATLRTSGARFVVPPETSPTSARISTPSHDQRSCQRRFEKSSRKSNWTICFDWRIQYSEIFLFVWIEQSFRPDDPPDP